jgi:hypothetical protein
MIEATCHCGAVRMEIAQPPEAVTSCNCSICHKLGTLWAYYTVDQVKFLSPPEATAAYSWGDRDLAFHHCRNCGCTTHWSGIAPDSQRMGVNSRLMPRTVTAEVPIRKLDGADTWTYLE